MADPSAPDALLQSDSDGSDAEMGSLVSYARDQPQRKKRGGRSRRRADGSLQQLDPYSSPITRLFALLLVLVLIALLVLIWTGHIRNQEHDAVEAELRRLQRINSQHRPWLGSEDDTQHTDPEMAIQRPKPVTATPTSSATGTTNPTTKETQKPVVALAAHRDPWQTCPKSVQLRLADVDSAAAIHAERERLSVHTCPLALFPLPDLVATADIFAATAKDLFIPDTADALAALPELKASSPRPNAFDESSACRNVCPISSRVADRSWRGFDADDGHLGLDQRRIWHLRDYVGTMSFRDQTHWVFGWPFNRPREDGSIQVRDLDKVLCCLPLGSLVYVHTFRTEEACRTLLPRLKRPVLLVLGGDDPSPMPQCPAAFNNHPMVLHSFMQNMASEGVGHPRVNVIPSSINMIIHRWINIFLLSRFVQEEHAKAARLAQSQMTTAEVDKLPSCAFMSQSASADFVRSIERCSGETMACSHERTQLRRLLHLDDYVPDPNMQWLHKEVLKPGFDVHRVRVFFEAYRAKFGELYFSAPTTWDERLYQGDQKLGENSPHEQTLVLPERVSAWSQASVMEDGVAVEGSDKKPMSLADRQARAIDKSVQTLKACKFDVGRVDAYSAAAFLAPAPSGPAPAPPAALLARFPLFGRWRKLALINFSVANGREPLYNHFCSQRGKEVFGKWLTCVGMLKDHADLDGNNPHLMQVYAMSSEYMYWLSPPGAGLDCHRTWEAMFVGSVPIVPRTSLDDLYADGDLPILVVDDLAELTDEFLLAHAPRFAQIRRDFPRRKLLQAYWMHFIAAKREAVVDAYLQSPTAYTPPPNHFGNETVNFEREWRRPMNKCWGGNMPQANQQPQC